MRRSTLELDPSVALSAWSETTAANADPWTHYTCKLVTPLYGGGVRAAEVDGAMPIRAAGIRGQLRFWWRIACGPADPKEMFQREAAIWGGIASTGPTASKVAVRVTAKPVQPNHLASRSQIQGFPAYALILDPNADPILLKPDYPSFELSIRCASDLTSEQRDEVLIAMRWWASFGGLGARTRRGLGAVRVEGLDRVAADDVEARGGRLLVRAPEKSPELAWKVGLSRLRGFRQGEHVGRNPPGDDPKRPGRSLWPEADAIRELSGHAHPKHAKRLVPTDTFPRAAFGLPIVFHFKDAPSKPHLRKADQDPDDHILEPADRSATDKRDRMASPLILRPYWDGKAWLPAALLLPVWKQAINQPLKFKAQPYCPTPWPATVEQQQRLAAQIKPMQKHGDDPLTAFMDYFEKD